MYKRILLKLSGESLMGEQGYGIDSSRLNAYARQIQEIARMGVEIGIVIGGGNIFRGLSGAQKGFDRVKGDQMGMLATVINSLALSSALEALGQKVRVLTSIRMEPVGDYFNKAKALRLFEKGNVVIIAGGTGNPYFTTDTASALRASHFARQSCRTLRHVLDTRFCLRSAPQPARRAQPASDPRSARNARARSHTCRNAPYSDICLIRS